MTFDNTKPSNDRDVLKALKAACKGLLFPSESDKQVKAFLWNTTETEAETEAEAEAEVGEETADTADTVPDTAVNEAALRSALTAAGKVGEGATVEAVPLETFFGPVVTEEDWWSDDEKEAGKRFRAMITTLEEHLTDVTMFRVEDMGAGSFDRSVVNAYVVGQTGEGCLAGVSTQLIET